MIYTECMIADMVPGLALIYLLLCWLPYRLAVWRSAPGPAWVLAWTILTGWTGWGYLAALLYGLVCGARKIPNLQH